MNYLKTAFILTNQNWVIFIQFVGLQNSQLKIERRERIYASFFIYGDHFATFYETD